MSETDDETAADAPRMRRRPLGYKRADVEAALGAREHELGELEDELDARDAELSELRQDIAALWLAFAQHDRMLGELRVASAAPAEPTVPHAAPDAGAAPRADEPAAADPSDEPAAADPSVGRQLADLDEVLAAIEMATQTLEQTYAEEIEEPEAETGAVTEPDGESSSGD